MEKRFGLTNELAKCADVSPILPKILFWTEGGLSPFVSFEKVLCIQGIVEEVSPMKDKNGIWMKILNLFFL